MLKMNLSSNREMPDDEGASSVNPTAGTERKTALPESESATVSDTLMVVPSEPEPSSDEPVAPEPKAANPEKNRRPVEHKEKVTISNRASDVPDEIKAAMLAARPPSEAPDESLSDGRGRKRVLAFAAMLVLLAAGYFAWLQRDFIYSLIPAKSLMKTAAREKAKPSLRSVAAPDTNAAPARVESPAGATVKPSPVGPLAANAPEAPAGSDPVLSALTGISKSTPPRVWLTSATASSDGAYDLKGMSFSHPAMQLFAAALARRGAVTARDIPVEAKNPDAVYTFHLSGKLNDLRVTQILDAIPASRLYALGDSLRALRKEADILVVRLPKVGKAYAESELPFELEGSYSGLQKTLEGFLFNRGIIIDRISVHPAASGKQYNRVRVSFSLRTISSI